MSPKKVHVQTTWNFRLQKIAQAVIKLMSHTGHAIQYKRLTIFTSLVTKWADANVYFDLYIGRARYYPRCIVFDSSTSPRKKYWRERTEIYNGKRL
jgi:hypothetical protein